MKTPLLIVSHVAAVLLGLLLFRSFQPAGPTPDELAATSSAKPAPQEATAPESSPPAKGTTKSNNRTGQQAPKASVHLLAWKALASENLTRPERMKASRQLLQKWIKEDWHAALDTVMKETPDDFALLDEFAETFTREPAAIWQIIEQKPYGIATHALLGRWQSSLVNCDEATVRKLADTLPERGKQAALETLNRAKDNEPYSGGG
ncbi:hypothetical protein [Luteolibacter soli]|uniref:DUF2059 domain-containing protein n=1 Tax=Luteolibacter soli TaxID=3135280 RepID=A0ABU9AUZ3_9BACT